MEFSLEGILETLLIGSIACLCILSLLFLIAPSFLRIRFIYHTFRFFLFEDGIGKNPTEFGNPTVTAAGTSLQLGDANRLFAGMLLCASLYGVGLMSESLSDIVTNSDFASSELGKELQFFSDPDIKISAFASVGASALRTGLVSQGFQEFMADYQACKDAELLGDRTYCPSCSTINSRAKSFYYTAKNTVYREPSYFQELSRLQNRIDFTRAASQVLAILSLTLLAAWVLGTISEGLWRYHKASLSRTSELHDAVFNRSPALLKALLKHWTHLDAGRCLGMGTLALFLAFCALYSWREHEDGFDKRVFGYYMSLPEQSQPHLAFAPRSTYIKFRLDSKPIFEPSAIEALGTGQYVLVANDKGDTSPLSIFRFRQGDGLAQSGGSNAETTLEEVCTFGLPREFFIGKIESLHVLDDALDSYTCLAAGTFDRRGAEFNRLVTFQLPKPIPVDIKRGSPIAPYAVQAVTCIDIHEKLGVRAGECVVEGLVARKMGNQIIMGIRRIGPKRSPIVALVFLEKEAGMFRAKQVWKRELDGEFLGSGVSSLALGTDGSLLVLTSIEEEALPGLARQVRGALWRIPKQEIENPLIDAWQRPTEDAGSMGRTYLAGVFIHKPEGVTVLDNGSLVIVFDDDGTRKAREYAPDTFALDQNESVFTIARPFLSGNDK